MFLQEILNWSIENNNISDIILSAWAKPCYKINGKIVYLDKYGKIINSELIKDIWLIMNEKQKQIFKEQLELDFSIELFWLPRFRVNVYYSNNWIWAVFRPIKTKVPLFNELNLPNKLINLVSRKNWLILITWSAWSWKTTTLASLLDLINTNSSKHIITIEDPIEFTYINKKSLIDQREIWVSTNNFNNALKHTLRQASDVIMIWEMRDLETFRLALRAAETWNLVIATLHTSWAARTISRIIDMFPWDEKDQIKWQLADSLLGVIWQDLIMKKDKKNRVLATELLINNTGVSNMIRKWIVHQINWAIETWSSDWMYTMSSCLLNLKNKWIIE